MTCAAETGNFISHGTAVPNVVGTAPEGQSDPQFVIRPPSTWRPVDLQELWRHRELLLFLTWRDVKVRYKQTVLGAAWAILQPAMMMVVFTVFFARMAQVPTGDVPYPVFVYAGLLPWTFFATAITNAANSVVGSEQLISKIYFPRLIVPFAAVGAAILDLAIAFSMLIVLMLCYGIMPGPQIAMVVPVVVLLTVAGLGVGTLLSALNVAYRDFRYVVPFLVQIWMFATPSVYMQINLTGQNTLDNTSQSYLSTLLALNPLTYLVATFRAATLGGPIEWPQLAVSSLLIAGVLVLGCLYFRRVEDGFADII